MCNVSFFCGYYWVYFFFFLLIFSCFIMMCIDVLVLSCFSHVRLFATPWSAPGFSVHGILQARILEWVKPLSHVGLFETPWTVACQAPPSMGFSRQEYWSGLPLPSPSFLLDGPKEVNLHLSYKAYQRTSSDCHLKNDLKVRILWNENIFMISKLPIRENFFRITHYE